MKTSVQARLDQSDRQTLSTLSRELGWAPSRVVREGIRLVAACHIGPHGRRIAGLGKFESGVSDLGTNKDHLRNFGK